MSCKICGRGSCASWMHSAEQQEAWSQVESMDDRQLRSEVVDLRGEVATLKAEINDDAIALRDMMSERDKAEAELAAERQKVRALTAILESICEEWGRNHDANPIGAGQRMETLASKALEKLEDEA